jgi:hypothetical protein
MLTRIDTASNCTVAQPPTVDELTMPPERSALGMQASEGIPLVNHVLRSVIRLDPAPGTGATHFPAIELGMAPTVVRPETLSAGNMWDVVIPRE